MRLLRYDYTVKHVPGKSLWTADTLSCAPLRAAHTDGNLLEDTNIYVDSFISNIPVSGDYLTYSPAELLMGCCLRTTVPALPTLLNPVLLTTMRWRLRKGRKGGTTRDPLTRDTERETWSYSYLGKMYGSPMHVSRAHCYLHTTPLALISSRGLRAR